MQLILGSAGELDLDPVKDHFVVGYIVKFACDFADIYRSNNRWLLVHSGLNLAFGKRTPAVSQTENFANQFDSDEFLLGVALAKVDLLLFVNEGAPTLNLATHLRETYHAK